MDPITIAALASAGTQAGGNIAATIVNSVQEKKRREQNERLVQMQNQQASAEADKAYRRSLPTNQVANLMQAGMSRAGALNTLTGGGSYTPAPVNAAQHSSYDIQAPDMSALVNVLTQEKQLKEQKRQFDANLSLERDKFEYEKKRTTENDAYDNIIKTFQAAKVNSEAQSANLDWLVKEFTQNERIDAEKQRLIAEKAKYLSEALQSKLYKGALEDVDPETLKSLFKYQAVLEMLGNIGHMSTEKAIQIIHDVKEILIPG